MPMVPILTERLRLRALQPGDAVAVFDVLGDETTTRLVSWRQPSLESTASFITRRMRDEELHGASLWAVEVAATDEVIGLCGFFPHGAVVELGYVVQARHWGNGYGTEAAAAAVQAHATARPDVTIYATIRTFNRWSLQVARRVGLRPAGSYTDDRGEMSVFIAPVAASTGSAVGPSSGGAATPTGRAAGSVAGMHRWQYGDLIVHRDVLTDGRPWEASPVRVVEDSDRWLATYLPGGARLEFLQGEFPTDDGRHPWDPGTGHHHWQGHGVLMVQRPGEHYACWHFWEGPDRHFAGWYLNLQEAFRRTPIGYDTQDLELDIVVDPDGSWRFKDREELVRRADAGRFTSEEIDAILALGDRLADELESGTPWWGDRWVDWHPDPAWGAAPLPSDWLDVPTPPRTSPATK